jgi:DNA polymerase-3 subunit delta'
MTFLAKNEKIIDKLRTKAIAGELSQAYLFFGFNATGKKTFALELGRILEKSAIKKDQTANDTTVIEPNEKGVIGIEESRKMQSLARQTPTISQYRLIIIDQAHCLTPEAQDALLKIVEELPEKTVCITITDDLLALKESLVSRFQKIYFPPIANQIIEEWLVKEHGVTKKEAKILADTSFGRPGYALKLHADEKIKKINESVVSYLESNPTRRKALLKELVDEDDFSLSQFLDELINNKAGTNPSSSTTSRAEWRRILNLRRVVDEVNVNPRLQLEALLR